MKNREKYADELVDIAINRKQVAINKENKPVKCCDIKCKECLLFKEGRSCDSLTKEWAEQEYVEPPVDWSKVAVDTPILVSNDNKYWKKRHFAGFIDRNVCTWINGTTSWSAYSTSKECWEYAKLAEQEDK